MMEHNFWIWLAIIVIFIIQLCFLISTLRKLSVFRTIFSKNDSDYTVIEDENTGEISGISSLNKNKILLSIIWSINNYLANNSKNTADFHLIKDMIERDCESAEDEINSQVPMPLYCGLMGTMFGILIGVGYLVKSGALKALIGTGGASDIGVGGIQTLLGGVALAMVTSIIGILFTTIGSLVEKDTKRNVETKKNVFLSWMQAKLLPELATDTTSALNKLTRNLNSFNLSFAQNTTALRDTLAIVNETTQGQAELLDTVRHLDISRLATANVEVYDRLRDASDEIGRFGQYVNGINDYVFHVRALSDKLGDANERTKMIEEMAAFFKQERTNLDAIKNIVAKTIGDADEKLAEAAGNFKESTAQRFTELTTHTAKEQEKFKSAVDIQQASLLNAIQEQKTVLETALQQRINDLQTISNEIEQLKPVRDCMTQLWLATQQQNDKIDGLTEAIMKLAQIKSNVVQSSDKCTVPTYSNKPNWTSIVGCLAVVVSCIVVMVKVLI